MQWTVAAIRTCGLLLILLGGAGTPAHALTLESIRLHGGDAHGLGDVEGGGFSLVWSPAAAPDWLTSPGEDVHWEFAASNWPNAAADGSSVQTVHFGPMWRYQPEILPPRSFIELGTSIARINKQRLADRDMGTHTHFTTYIGLGWRPRASADWHVGLRIRHTSNAGRGDPNPGLDIVMFELGIVP